MTKTQTLLKGLAVSVCLGGLLVAGTDSVMAADHNEAPGTQADPAADIADLYAWHTGTTLITAVTFAGLTAPGVDPTYDPAVRYGFHIDHDGDGVAEIDIWCRFATNAAADTWWVRCVDIPGEPGPVQGMVDTNIDSGNGSMVYAGPREDPFFMDFDGFVNTLMTGTLMFDSANDSFAGTNVTALVIEMDQAAAAADGGGLQIWATSERVQ